MTGPSPQPAAGRLVRFAPLLIAVAASLVYLPAISHRFVNWDDDLLLLDNPAVAAGDGLGRIWSTIELPSGFPNYPLTFTSYWVEHRLWGLRPSGYHAVNIILHALNAVLLFFVARSLGLAASTAGVAAALFAVHPVHVESVAWIAERKNVLSTAFALASFAAYQGGRGTRGRHWYGISLLLFAAALLSKTAVLVLPLSLLLADRFRDGRWSMESALRVAPMLGLAALGALQTMAAETESVAVPLADRPLLAGAALWFYAGKLLWPVDLVPVYPRWDVSVRSVLWWLPLAAAVGAAMLLRRARLDWRVRWGVAHFACMLLPVLGFVPYGFNEFSFVADRNVYLASAGLFVAAAVGVQALARRLPVTLVAAAVVAVLVVEAGLTVRQVAVWRDSESLWSEVLEHNPDAYVAHNNLGLDLIEQGRLQEAVRHLRAALASKEDYPEAHNNLALAFYRRGELAAAERHGRRAAELGPDDPRYARNLALTFAAEGKPADAERELQRALRLDPGSVALRVQIADASARQGRLDEALARYREALRIAPGLSGARNQMGRVLLALGRADEAAREFGEVVRRDPESIEARYNLALALHAAGQTELARREIETVLREHPERDDARELAARWRDEAERER